MKKNNKKEIWTIKQVKKTITIPSVHLEVKNVLIDDMQTTFTHCIETAKRKNADYAGENSDPFKNFKNCVFFGVPVEKGILVRMMDKMSRISNLIDKEAQVKDESINDTLDDLINYAAILKSYIKNKSL